MLPALAATVIVICYGCAGSRKEPDGQTPCRRCGGTGEPTRRAKLSGDDETPSGATMSK